jgi:hypothetical protein
VPNWNPNSPSAVGLEWPLMFGQAASISRSPVRALRVPSTAAIASVDDLQFRVKDTGVTGPEFRALLELFEDGDEIVDSGVTPVSTFIGRPNADDGANSNISSTTWNSVIPANDVTDLWNYINESVVWPPPEGFINDALIQESTTNHPYCFWLETSGFPSTARVLRLRSRMVGYAFTLGGTYSNRPFGIRLLHRPTGGIFTPPGGSGALVSLYTTLLTHNYGEINPVTGVPWTAADVQAFDGGDWVVRITSFASSGGTAPVLISYELLVDYIDPDNRVAVGVWTRPAVQASGLVTTDDLVTMPGGTAGWAKASGVSYVAGLRVANDALTYPNAPATPDTKWLAGYAKVDPSDPIEAPPGSGLEAEVYTLDGYGLYRSSSGPDERLPALLMRDGATVSQDSQLYVRNNDGPNGGMFNVTPTATYGQRFTAPASASYIGVVANVWLDTPTVDTTLTVEVRRVSDNVLMGGTLSITAAEFLALPAIEGGGNWRRLSDFLTSAAVLVSGTQYEIRFACTGTGGRWQLPSAFQIGGESIGFGGTTGLAVLNGGGSPVGQTGYDIPVVITQQPDAPLNVTATAELVSTRYGKDCFCEADGYEVVTVRWQQPALANFDRLTIERLMDGETEWHLVGTMPEDDDAWTDREVPRDHAVRYRLTNYVSGGGFSTSVETPWATPASRGCHLVFTSNDAPEMTVVYGFEPHVDFPMLDFDADQLLPIDGADFFLVLREAETRGIGVIVRLIINFERQPCDDTGKPLGMQALFEPIRRAARWPNIPYVCVLDHDGNRMFAHVSLDRATRDMPGNRYYCDATLTPLTASPVPVDERP